MTPRAVGLELPACQECGACCAVAISKWVEVNESDFVRLGNLGYLVQEGDVEKYSMRTVDGVKCVALQGDVGSSCSCAVYEDRPDACRGFTRASPPCVLAVGKAGLGKFTWGT